MKRALKISGWIIIAALLMYLIYLNSQQVDFNFYGFRFSLPAGVLFIAVLLIGGYAAFLLTSLRIITLKTSLGRERKLLQRNLDVAQKVIQAAWLSEENEESAALGLLEKDMQSTDARVVHSLMLCRAGDHKKALQLLPGDSSERENPAVMWRRIVELVHTGNRMEAVKEYEDIEDKNLKRHPLVASAARFAYMAAEEWDRAVAVQRDIFVNRKSGAAEKSRLAALLTARGQDLRKKKDFGEAEKSLQEAISVDETFVPAYENLGTLLADKSNPRKNTDKALKILKKGFSHTGAFVLLARAMDIFIQENRPEDLLQFAQDISSEVKFLPQALTFRIYAFLRLGMVDEAEKNFLENVIPNDMPYPWRHRLELLGLVLAIRKGDLEGIRDRLRNVERYFVAFEEKAYRCTRCNSSFETWQPLCSVCMNTFSVFAEHTNPGK